MDLPALWTTPFLHRDGLARLRASMLAEERTCPHGQRAGLRPSWLAWLVTATGQGQTGTAGQRGGQGEIVSGPGDAAHSLRGWGIDPQSVI